jgi:hypothetical protein
VSTAVSQLKATDRCDRCGAQAYVRVSLVAGGELHFCGHHARAHEGKLRSIAVEWHDETSRLTLTPTVAPDDER